MISAFMAPLWKYLSAGLLAVCLILGIALHFERRSLAKANQRIVELTQLREADRARYEAAQKEAELKNKEEVARTEAQYERNNHDAVANLNARLERLRSELSARTGANQGSSGKSSSPKADDPTGTAGSARVCLAPEELLRAAENEERFDQLITLILKQTDVN